MTPAHDPPWESDDELSSLFDWPAEVMRWRRRAACLGEDPEMFFPIGVTGRALDQAVQAKAVCRDCPVVDECLEWALAANQDAGVWGGKTEDERRTLRRSRQREGRKT